MALSSTSGIFAADDYSAAAQPTISDPLTRAVGNTNMRAPSANNGIDSGAPAPGSDAAMERAHVKAGLYATKFMMDLNNANTAYRGITSEIKNNLLLSNLNEQDTYARGRQAMLDRRTEGQMASDEALAHLAAQGLDVNSPGAQNVIKSYEAMGIYNAMREEINMYREAFKFDVEQIQLDYAQDMAGINRQASQMNAAISFAGGLAGSYLDT